MSNQPLVLLTAVLRKTLGLFYRGPGISTMTTPQNRSNFTATAPITKRGPAVSVFLIGGTPIGSIWAIYGETANPRICTVCLAMTLDFCALGGECEAIDTYIYKPAE